MIWLCSFYEYKIQVFMSKFKIPGVSFSLSRALGITQAKQKFADETEIPTSKAGWERKIGKMGLSAIFGKKRGLGIASSGVIYK